MYSLIFNHKLQQYDFLGAKAASCSLPWLGICVSVLQGSNRTASCYSVTAVQIPEFNRNIFTIPHLSEKFKVLQQGDQMSRFAWDTSDALLS